MPSTIRNSLTWILDGLEGHPTFVRKRMFGGDVAYIDGRLCIAVSARDEPWNGLLVCTSQEFHPTLLEEMPALRPHPVIGKWLYISQSNAAFEALVQRVVALVLAGDERVGVEPQPKPSRKTKLPRT